jgi:hypothetical protein
MGRVWHRFASRLRPPTPSSYRSWWARAGLVGERTTHRTDSTHVLAAVRDLTRLELVTEAVRAALEEVSRTAGHLLIGLVDEDWGRRYGRPVRLGKNPTRPKTRIDPGRRQRRPPTAGEPSP